MGLYNCVEMKLLQIVFIFVLSKFTNVMSLIATSPYSMNINMPDIRPSTNDAYVCTAKKLNPVESYIIQYEPDADGRTAHHMLLYGCQALHSQSHLYPRHWSCGGGELCSQMTIMYGWAKNAPAMKLPPKVGFLIGGNSSIQYLVLQVHYAKALQDGVTDNTGLKLYITTERQPFITGIHLLMADVGRIPPFQPKYPIDLNCKYKSSIPIHVFAYRVHAHKLGTVVSGYKLNIDNGSWTMLAKGNPQWPQAFYPMAHQVPVTSNDILAARCTYNSTAMNIPVSIGSLSSDEMCNLYLMYYTEYRNRIFDPVAPCVGLEYPDLVQSLPVGNDVPLPINEALEHHAHNSGNHHGTAITYANIEHEDSHPSPDVDNSHASVDNNLHPAHASTDQYSNFPNQLNSEFMYNDAHGWPSKTLKFGQISAVTVDKKGNPVIFHRGSHVWDKLAFDYNNNYVQSHHHAIPVPTVLTIDPISGTVLEQWGENLFFMPHGLTIDKDGHYWITDVALHQIFCFAASKDHKNLLTLGERFNPGNDEYHFCKPTSLAISESGEIYVADGYCNARIIRFSADGKFISQFGKPSNIFDKRPPVGTFSIPHKVVLLEDKSLLCVADRENGRIQCFTMTTGNFRFKIELKEFNGTLYSISYAKEKGLLFAVSGEAIYKDHLVKAFVFNVTDQKLITAFPSGTRTFTRPHDIAVSEDGEEAYVCEIGPNVVWKFMQEYHKSTKKVLKTPEVNVEIAHDQSPTHHDGHVQVLNSDNESKADDSLKVAEDEIKSFETSMIILALLGIPVLFLVLITVGIRLRKRGNLQSCSFGHLKGWLGGYRTPHPQKKFDLGNFLNPHKGFDKVSIEESDGEEDGSGSDIEEFNATTNKA